MSELINWFFEHALAFIGGALLLVGIAAAVTIAFRQANRRNEELIEKKDPREGE
jgi:hypothetical protein